ncbi:hypothetical protein BLOT_008424 [Blomia tropicalis]|nr:hypothetical protein BLOT_008424 [Blomia tropicalis]
MKSLEIYLQLAAYCSHYTPTTKRTKEVKNQHTNRLIDPQIGIRLLLSLFFIREHTPIKLR